MSDYATTCVSWGNLSTRDGGESIAPQPRPPDGNFYPGIWALQQTNVTPFPGENLFLFTWTWKRV